MPSPVFCFPTPSRNRSETRISPAVGVSSRRLYRCDIHVTEVYFCLLFCILHQHFM